MVAKYPAAAYRPLATTQGQAKMARHDIVCLHTMVGNLTSTDSMFHANGWGGTESHFGVGGKWGPDLKNNYDGRVFQWQDTTFSADANYEGNRRIISIETADNAPELAADIQEWTPKQLDAIVRLVAWACKTYMIPAVLVPDSKPTRRGIAYHRQGCEHSSGIGRVPGFLVTGGERWSTSLGKECPGTRRIAQLQSIVIPRVRTLLSPPPEDIMATKEELEALFVNLFRTKPLVPNKPIDAGAVQGADWTLSGVLAANDQKMDWIRREQGVQSGALASQATALGALGASLAGKASAASVVALEKKIDALIKLLTPVTPPVTKPPTTP